MWSEGNLFGNTSEQDCKLHCTRQRQPLTSCSVTLPMLPTPQVCKGTIHDSELDGLGTWEPGVLH